MLNGVKQNAVVQPGGVIQVQSADLPVGQAVEVIVLVHPVGEQSPLSHPLQGLSHAERLAKIRSTIGGWKNDAEMSEIFAVIARSRGDTVSSSVARGLTGRINDSFHWLCGNS
ncbi:MAG: hypothetical protein ACFB12_10440 [Leptolyngbyaceae cyanobacterium]